MERELPSYVTPWNESEVAKLAETLDGAVPDPLRTARLVYYNQILGHARVPTRHLLEDGTDTLHWPGDPYVRRMWAGGSLRWNKHVDWRMIEGERMRCREWIRDVQFKSGRIEGEEKVIVVIERVFGVGEEGEGEVTELAVEERNLAFMRRRSEEERKTYTRGEFEAVRYLKCESIFGDVMKGICSLDGNGRR